MGAAAKDVATKAVVHWKHVAPALTAPRSEEDREYLVAVLDEVLDAGGADEDSPLATLVERIGDLLEAGVCAEVTYPNRSLFLYNSPDPGYQKALAVAYNDWLWELFGQERKRFAPVGLVPVIDIQTAVNEATRLAKFGDKAIENR